MFLSELNYAHLLAEHEAAITRDLERQRLIAERLADDAERGRARQRRAWLSWFRMPRRDLRPMDTCPTCPSPA